MVNISYLFALPLCSCVSWKNLTTEFILPPVAVFNPRQHSQQFTEAEHRIAWLLSVGRRVSNCSSKHRSSTIWTFLGRRATHIIILIIIKQIQGKRNASGINDIHAVHSAEDYSACTPLTRARPTVARMARIRTLLSSWGMVVVIAFLSP